jgi:hypothetical protein
LLFKKEHNNPGSGAVSRAAGNYADVLFLLLLQFHKEKHSTG